MWQTVIEYVYLKISSNLFAGTGKAKAGSPSSWYSVILAIKDCNVISTGVPHSCQVYFSCSASNIYHHEDSSVYLGRLEFIFLSSFSQILQATFLNTSVIQTSQIKFNNWYSLFKCTIIKVCCFQMFLPTKFCLWCFYIIWDFSAGRHTVALKQAVFICCKIFWNVKHKNKIKKWID